MHTMTKASALPVFCLLMIAGAMIIPARTTHAQERAKVFLNEAEFRDRVLACWMGKNIGGTLGTPLEGKREANSVAFYPNLKPGEPAANDDLDLQLVWLKALEEHHGRVDARILGQYWLKYIPMEANEYTVGKMNMRRGILPPLSGEFDNAQWKHSNGAWIRSEIWACLAPGCPGLAARLAREDACVDHGAAEGMLAELFTAAVESAAFVESDRGRLIGIGLSMIPPQSKVARAVHAALDAKKAGKDWKTARQDVIRVTEDTGWFQAPRNIGFLIIGWLYGDDDFGKSLCAAVNCGDDTDCTGATLGSILGILHGTKGIPSKWSAPIGSDIKTMAVSGFEPPKNIRILTDRTVAMTKKMLEQRRAPVALISGPTDLSRVKELVLADTETAKSLWGLSPYQIVWNEADVQVVLDYLSDPLITLQPRRLQVTVRNLADQSRTFTITLAGLPRHGDVAGLPASPVPLKKNEAKTWSLTVTMPEAKPGERRMTLEVAGGATTVRIPLTLISQPQPNRP
jgi:ADP-ribosylglycohydrolase